MPVSPEERANPNVGWKIHLNFDASNRISVARVREAADQLAAEGRISACKLGEGGGAKHGENRKEATVYVGALDEAILVAEALERELGTVLLPPDRATMNDDVPMTQSGMTWGRFTALHTRDGKYHQYGLRGVCALKVDMQLEAWGGEPDPERRYTNALHALHADFGDYFTGPEHELGDLIELAYRVEREGSRAVFGWDPAPDVTPGLDAAAQNWWDRVAPNRSPAPAPDREFDRS